MKIQHLMAFVVLSLATVPGARAAVLAGPITNAANGHAYYLLSTNTWTQSENEAIALGGHLVTINDDAENNWVYDTFGQFGVTRRYYFSSGNRSVLGNGASGSCLRSPSLSFQSL